MGGSSSKLYEKFEELKDQGYHVGAVITRQGFGHAVERQGTFGSDYIVKYEYPTKKYEATIPGCVVRADFMVIGAKYNKNKALMVHVALGKDQTRWVSIADNMFDQRPFKDKYTLRVIVTQAYDTYKIAHPNQSYSSDSTKTMTPEHEYEYQYEYEPDQNSLSNQD